jgi:hypothetical protein
MKLISSSGGVGKCFVTSNERPEDLRNGKTFSNWSINEIHDVCIFVHREPGVIVRSTPTKGRRLIPQISRLRCINYTSSSDTEYSSLY